MTPTHEDAAKLIEAIGDWMSTHWVELGPPHPCQLLELVVAHLALAYTAGEVAGMLHGSATALKAFEDVFGPDPTKGS